MNQSTCRTVAGNSQHTYVRTKSIRSSYSAYPGARNFKSPIIICFPHQSENIGNEVKELLARLNETAFEFAL